MTSRSPDVDDLLPALRDLRRDLHAHPELGFAEYRTARVVAAAMHELGLGVATGVGGTGVVATLRNGDGGASIGLRADMDALPMQETSGLPHASRHPGAHHGCGHDGHTAMLVGAARQLARTRRFNGTVHFIFQPAEEGQGGADAMIRDGLFDRFSCNSVYALHNWPGLAAGVVQTRRGAIMAAADRFELNVRGRGGHAAMPHTTPDAVLAAAQLVQQLHTIVSRRIDPVQSAVLSVTRIQGGHAHNVLPDHVAVTGTVRTFDPSVQDSIEAALRATCEGVERSMGVSIEVEYIRYYPATVNTPSEADFAIEAATAAGFVAQEAPAPAFTSEDFAFMLRARPGAYLWLGQGRADPGPAGELPLHHPAYDFNDDVLPLGVKLLVSLAERALPP